MPTWSMCVTFTSGTPCRVLRWAETYRCRQQPYVARPPPLEDPHDHHCHRRRRAHPDRQAVGRPQGLHRHGPRWRSPSRRALERAGVTGDQVDYVIMGHVLQAGQGQITARQAAVKGGIPMNVPALTINKVCLSGPRRDRAGRPADPRRRGRGRRRRRHGVDDQRAVPAAEGPPGLPLRQRRAARRDLPRRPVRRLRQGADGRGHRAGRRQLRTADPRGAGRVRRPQPRARRRRDQGRPVRRRDRAGRDPAAQGRPGRRLRGRGRAPRHDGGVARQAQGPPSSRTAPSPRATPRRSPTAPPRSS